MFQQNNKTRPFPSACNIDLFTDSEIAARINIYTTRNRPHLLAVLKPGVPDDACRQREVRNGTVIPVRRQRGQRQPATIRPAGQRVRLRTRPIAGATTSHSDHSSAASRRVGQRIASRHASGEIPRTSEPAAPFSVLPCGPVTCRVRGIPPG